MPKIRLAGIEDAPRIADIYNHYVTSSIATFEEAPVEYNEMARRISSVSKTFPWLIASHEGNVIGYAYASEFKGRSAYSRTVETSIYIDQGYTGRHLGSRLYENLLDRLGLLGVHTAIGVLAIPNPSSEALHEKLGFSRVGVLKEAGYKFGSFIDVAYYQLMLGHR